MENTSTGNKPLKDRTSHSNFRKGLHDYNDGENVTHHLGNDDYDNGANITAPYEKENFRLDGKSASGNDFLEDDIDEDTIEENSFDEGADYE